MQQTIDNHSSLCYTVRTVSRLYNTINIEVNYLVKIFCDRGDEMKESAYKSYGELPLFLDAKLVAQVLGISPSSGYELLHQQDFPTLKIGNRLVVPKEKFIEWAERNTGGDS